MSIESSSKYATALPLPLGLAGLYFLRLRRLGK